MKNNMTQEQKDQLIEHLKWLNEVSHEEDHEMYTYGIHFCIGSIVAWMNDCDKELMKQTNSMIYGKAAE